ncbi:MAG: hypothetical protein ACRDQ7_05345 [Haloechinothrix sp.]
MSSFLLPPDVTTETFAYANGRTVMIYRQQYRSYGPVLVKNGEGRMLAYEYASYVFLWPRGTTQLAVGHGTIMNHMFLWNDMPITGEWTPETLTAFAQRWAHRQFEKFGG